MKHKFNIGDFVEYIPPYSKKVEKGRVKGFHSPDSTHVFVVYHCNNDWDNYKDYTAASTPVRDLRNPIFTRIEENLMRLYRKFYLNPVPDNYPDAANFIRQILSQLNKYHGKPYS